MMTMICFSYSILKIIVIGGAGYCDAIRPARPRYLAIRAGKPQIRPKGAKKVRSQGMSRCKASNSTAYFIKIA